MIMIPLQKSKNFADAPNSYLGACRLDSLGGAAIVFD